jgi:hypothetical protein
MHFIKNCTAILNLTTADLRRIAGVPVSEITDRENPGEKETLIYPGVTFTALYGKVKSMADNEVRELPE